ncbi:ankyrin [Amniculicola lignicola CBS 123094]|uniref:Ankyrin n=1 Tax=Amniculicola lignicola CBS 123094 TaxID=1392246 RepID=A0A6A5WQL4_9PLEO|nr:ankyrin [Amniculicola lignicola CBS 123094]
MSKGMTFVDLASLGQAGSSDSTTNKHLIYNCGGINGRFIQKFEKETAELGKGSYRYAWVLDKLNAERDRGVTTAIALWKFETPDRHVTVIESRGLLGPHAKKKKESRRAKEANRRNRRNRKNGIKYEPVKLDGSEFRLLRLLKGTRGSPIQCKLFIQQLGQAQKYYAQSYTWGKKLEMEYIFVDGQKVEVQKNLANALHAFRREEVDVILWVDALCINQGGGDDEEKEQGDKDQEYKKEKSQQITLMADIYRNAEEVYIYLGLGNRDTNLAMDLMQQIEERDSDWMISDRLKNMTWTPDGSSGSGVPDAKRGLRDMLIRTWFERVWILQEVAFARKARIFCGIKSVSPTAFMLAPEAAGIEPRPQCKAVFDILQKQWEPKKQPIDVLLRKFRHSDATVQHDKIYALLNMSSDAHKTDYLRPDYSKSLGEVIYDTAIFIIGYRGDTIIEVFTEWKELEELVNNIHILPRLAVQWALDTKKARLIKDLLQKYQIEYDRWGATDNLTKDVMKLAIKTQDMPLCKALLQCHKAWGQGGMSRHHRLPNVTLEWAVDAGNSEVVKEILQRYDSELENGKIESPYLNKAMEWALETERIDVVREILQHYNRKDVLSKTTKGQSTEFLAAKFGDMELLQWVEPQLQGRSLDLGESIREAYKGGHEDMVLLMLKYARCISGDLFDNLLTWSVSKTQPRDELRKLLLDRWSRLFGREWEARHVKSVLEQDGGLVDAADGLNKTPLMQAANHKQVEIVRLLLNQGAKVNLKSYWSETALSQVISSWEATKSWKKDFAAEITIIGMLLSFQADPNIPDNKGLLPLHKAIQIGSTELTKLLLEGQANPNIKDGGKQLPLHMAIRARSIELTALLLEATANPNIPDTWLPLQIAVAARSLKFTKMLLENGADPNILNGERWLPLQLAVDAESSEITTLLLERGANVDGRAEKSQSPLFIASERGNTSLTRLLLDRGAEINAENEQKMTPLMYASYYGRVDVVHLLLNSGAKYDSKDKFGHTALDHAKNYYDGRALDYFTGKRRFEAAQALEQHEKKIKASRDKDVPVECLSIDSDTQISSDSSTDTEKKNIGFVE